MTQTIYFDDGTAIKHKGDLDAKQVLVMICRDNVSRDTTLFDSIAVQAGTSVTLIWHEHSLVNPGLKKSLFTSVLNRIKPQKQLNHINDIPFRCKSLKEFIGRLNPNSQISILSQSGGGRIASLIADELPVHKMVCLGYPFRRENHPVEPERFMHLATLKTPFLILQGTRDSYGTPDNIHKQYALSPSVFVEAIDADHDFIVSDEETQRTIQRVLDFLDISSGDKNSATSLMASRLLQNNQ